MTPNQAMTPEIVDKLCDGADAYAKGKGCAQLVSCVDSLIATVTRNTEIERLRAALTRMVNAETDKARRSFQVWTGSEWFWTDTIWKEADPLGFQRIAQARAALEKP